MTATAPTIAKQIEALSALRHAVSLSGMESTVKMYDAILSSLRSVEALQRDAARFQKLQNMLAVDAQALFWNIRSRRERAKAIDAVVLERSADPAMGAS
jgi:hypothetical protein